MHARLRHIPLPTLAAAAVVLMATALALIFFYAPLDADQGLSQKIFYIHVPIALTAYPSLRPSLSPRRNPRSPWVITLRTAEPS